MTSQHGGYRPGAGRKPTGRKKQVLYITDEEHAKVKELIDNLRGVVKMTKYNYQIDTRSEDGTLDRYDMIKSTSLTAALQDHLGEDYKDYELTKGRVNGKTVITARCPAETAGYLEVSRSGN